MAERHRTKYPCANPDCQTLIRKKGELCRQCYLEEAHRKSRARIKRKEMEREHRRAVREQKREAVKETARQREIKRTKRLDNRFKAERCGGKPIWKIEFVEMGKTADGKPIIHEIGKCGYYKNGLCETTKDICPLNGMKDFTEVQNRVNRKSRGLKTPDNIGASPASKVRAKALISQANRGRPQAFDVKPLDRYAVPTRNLFPTEGDYLDDIFRVMEK